LTRSKTGSKFLRGGVNQLKLFTHSYDDIISVENLLEAWKEFVKGKRRKADVQDFQYRLMENILVLHRELKDGSYKHGGYKHFKISDPKPRDIHKATVRDRLLHHALYRQLYPHFDRRFIADSFSCRRGKGTHRAMDRFRAFAFKVSRNHRRSCYVLKCDIRKFFASIDQSVLMEILEKHIQDNRLLGLIKEVVGSFDSGLPGKGLPLGNLTSQLLVNIYMNEFDQFAKHELRAKYYIRYADDFVILSPDRQSLVKIFRLIERFLRARLKLELHPDKVFIKTFASGVDFLGWVHFPDHQVLRTATKRRMWRRVGESKTSPEVLVSYLGLLKHGNTYKLRQRFSVDFE
jgi:retron-type reverse transcriptase